MKHSPIRASRGSLVVAAALLLLAGPLLAAQQPFRSIDGSGNNLAHPDWGKANTTVLRLTTVAYGDLINTPAGAGRQSARLISNLVCDQGGVSIPNALPITDFIWQWGQFIDHDVALSGEDPPNEPFHIPVPTGDTWFDPDGLGGRLIHVFRSIHVPGTSPAQPRQQINTLTAYIDGSNVYGSDQLRADTLRAMDGTGMLKENNGLLPFNTFGLPNFPDDNDPSFFIAGDVRCNEQLGLTAMHTLFMREHNTLAQRLKQLYPWWTGKRIYLTARALVGAEIQKITYEEWLPILLGPSTLDPYAGYQPGTDAGIANSFANAAYRVGHTFLSPFLQRLQADGNDIPQGPVALKDAFFSPDEIINAGGIEPLLRGLASQRPQEVDAKVVDDVRNFLFGPPGAGGFDLAALNMQRGREHGLPGYNQMRVDLLLAPKAGFGDVTSDAATAAALAAAYATPWDIDPWLGGLAEDHAPGALVGELIQASLKDQFERLRDGDRFWWERYLRGRFKRFVEGQTLAKIIRRNTPIGAELQDNVFLQPGP